LACRDLYDEPVSRAGYAYVGDIGPNVETRSFDESELRAVEDDIVSKMNRISNSSFREYHDGEHCQWCRHTQLPCAPPSLQSD
jgi:DNA helicase-2/ATP-dependent DNA helicase PcrA